MDNWDVIRDPEMKPWLEKVWAERHECSACANSYREKGVEGIYCKHTDWFVAEKTDIEMECDLFSQKGE